MMVEFDSVSMNLRRAPQIHIQIVVHLVDLLAGPSYQHGHQCCEILGNGLRGWQLLGLAFHMPRFCA